MKRMLYRLALCGATCGLLVTSGAVRAVETANAPAIQDVRLQGEGLLVGKAVTSQGTPRENVRVALAFQGKTIAETTTNKDGLFAVKGLRGGVHVVETDGNRQVARLWTADAAPEAAAEGLVLADGQIVRGQQGGGVGNFLANNAVGLGIIGAAAGTAVAVAADSGDSSN